MKSKQNIATKWLGLSGEQKEQACRSTEFFGVLKELRENPQKVQESNNCGFNPVKHLTKGWTGHGLINKDSKRIYWVIDKISQDILFQLKNLDQPPHRFLSKIEADYISFRNNLFPNLSGSESDFNWKEFVKPPEKNFSRVLESYRDSYLRKTSLYFLMNLKLALKLFEGKSAVGIKPQILSSPQSFISKKLKEGGLWKVRLPFFQSNILSWYRPGSSTVKKISGSIDSLIKLKNGEFNALINSIYFKKFEKNKNFHGLSNVYFGDFLSSTLLSLPQFVQSLKNSNQVPQKKQKSLLSLKFVGPQLHHLQSSHTLAQNKNCKKSWKEILSPVFDDEDFFTNLISEFFFIMLLAKMAPYYKEPVVDFIAGVLLKRQSGNTNTQGQMSFLRGNISHSPKDFQRIVLNCSDESESLSPLQILNKLELELTNLSHDGYGIVLSKTNLISPSLKEKLQAFLKNYSIQASIDLKKLDHKGGVPNYLFLIKKINDEKEDHSCLNIVCEGKLKHFSEFSDFTFELESFYNQYLYHHPPMINHRNVRDMKISFWNDSIVNGRFINKGHHHNNNSVHPNFLEKLSSSCISLDSLFQIKTIRKKDFMDDGTDNLREFLFHYKNPYVGVINFKNPELPQVLIQHIENISQIIDDIGHANCFYFALFPKFPYINLEFIKEFFLGPIGKQIIDSTFVSSSTKIKEKFSSLLIPKSILKDLKFSTEISLNSEEILKKLRDVNTLSFDFEDIQSKIQQFVQSYGQSNPSLTISNLSKMKSSVEKTAAHFNNAGELIYSNSEIQSKILALSKSPLFSLSKDYKLTFKTNNIADLEHFCTEYTIKISDKKDLLSISKDQQSIIEMKSNPLGLDFFGFVYKNLPNIKLNQFLETVTLPTSRSIQEIVEEFMNQKTYFSIISETISKEINKLFTQTISCFNSKCENKSLQ